MGKEYSYPEEADVDEVEDADPQVLHHGDTAREGVHEERHHGVPEEQRLNSLLGIVEQQQDSQR